MRVVAAYLGGEADLDGLPGQAFLGLGQRGKHLPVRPRLRQECDASAVTTTPGPASRFWHFQLIEAALFATLAAILLAVAVWQLRRRVG